MILIVDCGSTKAEWVALEGGEVQARFVTNGFNPNFCDEAIMAGIIKKSLENVDNHNLSVVSFYGSGCGSATNQDKVKSLFKRFLTEADIEVYPDTLASCHALFGRKAGVACILGTGSNVCQYDGEKITKSAVSLGFMIGDEGSGCHIGKRLVHDYFLGLMPEDMRKRFAEKYNLDRESFLERIYQGEQPSKYLAEFTSFASENIDNEYVVNVLKDSFNEFIRIYLTPCVQKGIPIGFVGSVAYHFQSILKQCLFAKGIKCEKIVKSPISSLLTFYSSL